MAEKSVDLLTKLQKGEKVECLKCHKGHYIPYNTTPDKAHYFSCSNKECDGHFHWDPAINIE